MAHLRGFCVAENRFLRACCYRRFRTMITDPDTFILQNLLQADPDFVSGSVLAKKIGITRVAVWARLEKLRESGFEFEAVRHKGYKLVGEPAELNASLLRAYLARDKSKAKIIFFPEIDSTNSEAERQLAGGRDTPFVVLASKQTQGRGRLGRAWHSPEEGNCYLSFVFRPQLTPERMRTFTLWMGVNMCRLLNEFCDLPIRIKWPNDLVLENRKVGGMLTEARVDADHTRDLVFGLGLNVNSRCEGWPSDYAAVATSLADIKGEPLPINPLATQLIETGLTAFRRFCKGDYKDEFHALWDRYDAIRGQKVSADQKSQIIGGVAEGIDADGSLRLRTESGEIINLRAGEVSLGTKRALSREPA